MTYPIKEIADLAGVTTRTLHHYEEIGLLSPVSTGENGNQYYDQSSLLRLQQILFFQELDVPLGDIQLIMTRQDFNLLQALENNRTSLKRRVNRLDRLLAAIDQTITTVLDIPLKDIQLISRQEFNLLRMLEIHRLLLEKRVHRLDRLLATINQTLSTIEGGKMMSAEGYFDGFDETGVADNNDHIRQNGQNPPRKL